MDGISYNARIYKTEIYKGVNVTTYYVQWKVVGAPKPFREPFRHMLRCFAMVANG